MKVDMSLTSPKLARRRGGAAGDGAKRSFDRAEWERSMSVWSGTRPGTRAGCRKRRASSSTCCELPFIPKPPHCGGS